MNYSRVNSTEFKRPEILVSDDMDSFITFAAFRIAREINLAITERGLCSIALCGGKTPRSVYEALANSAIDWSKVRFFFGDERCVPPDHPESNFSMIWNAMLRRLPADPSAIIRMQAESRDLADAADAYAAKLPERLDIILLGIGEDGHTASLFPNSPALHEEKRTVVLVEGPKKPSHRLTITPPVIRAAHRRILMAAGLRKAAVVARAIEGPFLPLELPVQLALDGVWILDREAASMLTGLDTQCVTG
jgi:6-phosphogluconolactonase